MKLILLLSCLCLLGQSNLMAQGSFPGTIITKSPDGRDHHPNSPSILVLKNGHYLATNDWGGSLSAGNYTSVHQSKDSGRTWSLICMLPDMQWGSLFMHRDSLYIIGTKAGNSDIVVRRSLDSGFTWTRATNAANGVLRAGRYHTGPTPVIAHMGRIWKAFEADPDPNNNRDFRAFMMSAAVNSNLLLASSWTFTNEIRFEERWLNAKRPNWFEGNVVPTADGVANLLRLETWEGNGSGYPITGFAAGKQRYEIIARCNANAAGTTLSFDTLTGFISFKGAESKFTIRYDSVSGYYWTISNRISNIQPFVNDWTDAWNQRNVLVLQRSPDLVNWTERKVVMRFAEGRLMTKADAFGFQYPDWQIQGNDLVVAVRTAWYGLNRHDGNLLTFHRVANFRTATNNPLVTDLRTALSGERLYAWNLRNKTGSEATVGANVVASGLGSATLSRGAGLIGINLTNSFAAAPNGNPSSITESGAIADNRYFQISFTTPNDRRLSLRHAQVRLRRNSNGLQSHHWHYSIGNQPFKELSEYPFNLLDTGTNGYLMDTAWLGSVPALQSLAPGTLVQLRLYVWKPVASGGNIAIGRYPGIDTPSLWIDGLQEMIPNDEALLAGWDFTGQAATDTLEASQKHSNLSAARLYRGAGLPRISLNNAFASSVLRVAGQAGSKLALKDSARYFELRLNKANNQTMQMSFLRMKLRRNSGGPCAYQVFYSINSPSQFTSLDSGTVLLNPADSGLPMPLLDLRTVAALQQLPATSATIRFRIYVWGVDTSGASIALGRDLADGPSLQLIGRIGGSVLGRYSLKASGSKGLRGNELSWQLIPPATEGLFHLWRKTEGLGLERIAQMPVQPGVQHYRFTDEQAQEDASYFVSMDQSSAAIVQSNTVHLKGHHLKDRLSFVAAGPIGSLTLLFCTAQSCLGRLQIFGSDGGLLHNSARQAAEGSTQWSVVLKGPVHAGFARFVRSDGRIFTCLFTR